MILALVVTDSRASSKRQELKFPSCRAVVGSDGNADGLINLDDKSTVWSPQSGGQGYYSADFNMNSQIDNIDKNDYWLKNKDNSSQVPE